MKFIDEVTIDVKAGKGGSGSRHFRREKFIPLGGPDGGNGGRGGSVILVADPNVHTLLDFHFHPVLQAEDGSPGEGNNRDGRAGKDLRVKVPVGTQILAATDRAPSVIEAVEPEQSEASVESYPELLPQIENQETESTPPGRVLTDLSTPGQEFVIAQGGRGGRGNSFFKSPTNRAPQHFQPGEEGAKGRFTFSLKLVADVGLVGFPNAGKSTLISRISAARPKIADYPFTTLVPNLGVVQAKGGRSFVVADVPGLIPDAHKGKGLGIKFLKHLERTRALAHLIDPNQLDPNGEPIEPLVAYDRISTELREFSEELASKPQIVLITKADTLSDPNSLSALRKNFEQRGIACRVISSASGLGIPELIEEMAKLVESNKLE